MLGVTAFQVKCGDMRTFSAVPALLLGGRGLRLAGKSCICSADASVPALLPGFRPICRVALKISASSHKAPPRGILHCSTTDHRDHII